MRTRMRCQPHHKAHGPEQKLVIIAHLAKRSMSLRLMVSASTPATAGAEPLPYVHPLVSPNLSGVSIFITTGQAYDWLNHTGLESLSTHVASMEPLLHNSGRKLGSTLVRSSGTAPFSPSCNGTASQEPEFPCRVSWRYIARYTTNSASYDMSTTEAVQPNLRKRERTFYKRRTVELRATRRVDYDESSSAIEQSTSDQSSGHVFQRATHHLKALATEREQSYRHIVQGSPSTEAATPCRASNRTTRPPLSTASARRRLPWASCAHLQRSRRCAIRYWCLHSFE